MMATSSDKLEQGHRTLRLATQPDRNATIRASAGTGKTYLLVSRLARLLLAGAEPGGLLAITFTRKAAAEMHQRLQQRLREWLQADTPALEGMLTELGVDNGPEQITRARHLFERLLRNDRQPRITTFHAFCQDILRRFPVEADVPPGFALLEDSGILAEQAWDGLWHDATRSPDTDVARALQSLLLNCGGIESCRRALFDFLHHRSDWWAFTEQAESGLAVQRASDHLREQLGLDDTNETLPDFYTEERTALLQAYCDLLAAHDTAANRKQAALITKLLADLRHVGNPPSPEYLTSLFYTTTGEPRKVTESKARARAVGEAGQQRFLELHAHLKKDYDKAIERQRRLDTWQLSTAWYRAGQRLLDHFQQLKQEQRLLDFTDLEWQACRLLNDGQHSHWIQYKLDRRISHILVDEFQDTNPTQWRLLLPLLEELAASGGHGNNNEQRSVFLVGDEKQSIYRFRRADPRLFSAAGQWLQQNTGAVEYPLSVSWRSSPAIIEVINRVFSQEHCSHHMPGFTRHDTHRQLLSGRVELLPLVTLPTDANDTEDSTPDFRNPLYSPRPSVIRDQHRDEGRQISEHIQSLLEEFPYLAYSDILVLLRHRTHQHDYEQAFRKAGIPYVGSGRKTLLDTLEIQDIVALLQTLISPGNNHALAQTLRSPLFACSDDDLVLLAAHCRHTPQDWFGALMAMAENDTTPALSPALQRAAHWLPHWRHLAQLLPVHDLLDRIFAEGNVEARFDSAFPEHLRRRVRANLTRLVEVALEIDSGRYPSLPAFLNKLNRLHQHAPESLQQTALADDETDNAVRIMTVHAAKGLEAPVVYVVDSGFKRPPARAWQTLIDWPSDASRPDSFLLTGRSRTLDDWSRQRLESEGLADAREDANLLYVALTRAQRFLFISGCAHKGEQLGWYQIIATAFGSPGNDETQILAQHAATLDDSDRKPDSTVLKARQETPVPEALSRPLIPASSAASIRPSDNRPATTDTGDSTARDRGSVIHRLLELCTNRPPLPLDEAAELTAHESHITVTDPQFQHCVREVDRILSQPDLHDYFDPAPDARIYNEIALLYDDQGSQIHGIIDRLIVEAQQVTLIDYKTQDHDDVSDSELSAPYHQQIQLYIEGLRRLWPTQKIHAVLIFTRSGRQVVIDP